MRQSLRLFFVVAGLAMLAGCPACFPGKVGPGAARLTIRNVGAMGTMINADTSCGFSAMSVLSSPVITGTPGGMGTVTFQATDCVIDSGADGKVISTGCTGATTTVSGKVTITAKRTIAGQITGNPMNPVIPAGPDSVTITLEKATFDNFKVVSSTSESKLTQIKGNLTAVLKPRLAVNKTNGACSVATPNVTFSDVKYDAASEAFVDSPGNAFGVTIDGSSLAAQNGVNGDKTNTLSGLITVFGKEVDATVTDGLDPDFNLAKFDEGWQCNPDLVSPVSYMCADLKPRLAGGVARLTARTIGNVTSMIDANTTCGFSAPAVGGTPTMMGTVGAADGEALFRITTPCTIDIPTEIQLGTPDCNMVTTRVVGKVNVSGTKRVRGYRTGNPRQPIVPTTPQPALFDLTMTFENFELKKSDSTSSLLIKTGGFSGKVEPRTAIDSATGACSISTPVVRFSDMSWNASSTVQLTSDGNKFDLGVGASMLNAQNGTLPGAMPARSNIIEGTITVDGMPYPLAAMGEPLDTAFNQATFDMSFACAPRIVIPPVDAACNFRQALGTGAARLLAKNFATATSLTDAATNACGFKSAAVVGGATQNGMPGMPGSVVFNVAACQTMLPAPASITISTNCLGIPTKAGGSVTVTGAKTVLGLRTPMPPFIVPLARDAGTFDLTAVNFAAFELFDLPNDGGMTPSTKSTLTGMGSVVVRPVAGEADAGTGFPVYSISTPIAGIDNITMASGTMTLISDGNQFNVALTNVALNAYNGSQYGRSNTISGMLSVEGQPITIAPGTPLDPAFNQARFDQGYACSPGLQGVVPP